MKCKNIECEKETVGKRVYCSLSCRNIFVNKYLRDYSKYSNTCEQKKKEREGQYLKNPNCCRRCGTTIPFEKIHDNEIFCSHSCSASYNNKNKKGAKYTLTELGLENLRKSALKNFKIKPKVIVPKICKGCEKVYSNSNDRFCNIECKKVYHEKYTNRYQRYKGLTNFKFNLSDYTVIVL